MIDGRVLDTSALLDAATGRSIYFRALIVAAAELGTTLLIPATAWAEAWALAPEDVLPLLELVGTHPLAIHDDLDEAQGRRAGELARTAQHRGLPWDVRQAQVVAAALERGWRVVTADPDPLLDVAPLVLIEQLP